MGEDEKALEGAAVPSALDGQRCSKVRKPKGKKKYGYGKLLLDSFKSRQASRREYLYIHAFVFDIG